MVRPENQCCICLASLDTHFGRQTLPCQHVFHENCLTEMRRKGGSGRCPLCREEHEDLTPLQVLLDKTVLNFISGKFVESRRFAADALDLDPDCLEANKLLGHIYLWGRPGVMQDKDAGLMLYEKAYSMGDMDAAYNIAVASFEQGDTGKAWRLFHEAHGKGHIQSTHQLGLLCWNERDAKRAKELLHMAHSKGIVKATYDLGMIFHQQGETRKAQELLQMAHLKGYPPATRDLAGRFLEKGDRKKARELLQLARFKGDVDSIFELAIWHQDEGNMKVAREMLEEAHLKGHTEATFSLGLTYHKEGNFAKASDLLQQAHLKGYTEATFNLALLCNGKGDTHMAIELLQEARAKGHKKAATNLGNLFFSMGEAQKARDMFQEGHGKGDMNATEGLGFLYELDGNVEKAHELYQLAHLGGNADATFLIGRLYAQQGDTTRAQEFLQKAHAKGHKHAACGLGIFRQQEGDKHAAHDFFQQAHDHGHWEATARLGALYEQNGDIKMAQRLLKEADSKYYTGLTFASKAFAQGDAVQIHGLTSAPGQLLNGCVGKIICFDDKACRFGVGLGTHGKKLIKAENLSKVEEPPPAAVEVDPVPSSPSPDSLECGAPAINAQVSNALLRSRPGDARGDPGKHVVLLEVSRDPEVFREALLKADSLSQCRDMLAARGLDTELESGAKIFVQPEHYDAVREAIDLNGLSLRPRHVIVDPMLEKPLRDIIVSLPKRHKVYQSRANVVPLCFAQAASDMKDCPPEIKRSFIHIRVASSLCSTSNAGPRTSSTTDVAAPRKGQNPRRGGKRSHKKLCQGALTEAK